MCNYEDYYVQIRKTQNCAQVSAVIRTFTSMLNLNPSSGCQPRIAAPAVCDNATAETEVCRTVCPVKK